MIGVSKTFGGSSILSSLLESLENTEFSRLYLFERAMKWAGCEESLNMYKIKFSCMEEV